MKLADHVPPPRAVPTARRRFWIRWTWHAAIYALLAGGSVLFALPFVWMAGTSVKVDRELFAPGLHLLPRAPHPAPHSPYVDAGFYPPPAGPRDRALLPRLRALAAATGFVPPADIDSAAALDAVATGLLDKLARRLPRPVWDGPQDALLAAARPLVDRNMVGDLFAATHRRLCLGQIRIWSRDVENQEVGAGRPMRRRLELATPATARLVDRTEDGLAFASVNYDLTRGDRVALTASVVPRFPADRLQRIQLYLKPDDSWHDLMLAVEFGGFRYAAVRALPLANFEWTMATWQAPGPDDTSTKIKTWIVWKKAGASPATAADPRKIILTLTVRRVGPLGAWWNKLALNYGRVFDTMPLGRYLHVSLFLVLANVVLTVFASSLVAYAFARLTWPGRDLCFMLMLATLMIPGQVTMIPHFLIWKSVGAYNTLTPLWLGSAFGNAFFIFLMRQFLMGIPRDLEDAARLDGCGTFRIYWHLMLPLVKPALAAIAIFTFMGTWNDFMGPLIYLADQRLYPLAFGLYAFSVQVDNSPALTMAASLLMTVPVILIFFFAQKYFIQGITLTGMKG